PTLGACSCCIPVGTSHSRVACLRHVGPVVLQLPGRGKAEGHWHHYYRGLHQCRCGLSAQAHAIVGGGSDWVSCRTLAGYCTIDLGRFTWSQRSLTMRSSRHRFVTPNTWQVELAMCSSALRSAA